MIEVLVSIIEWILTPGVDQNFAIVLAALLGIFVVLEIRAHFETSGDREKREVSPWE